MAMVEIVVTGVVSTFFGAATGAWVASRGKISKESHSRFCPENRSVMIKQTHDKDCPANRDLMTKAEHEKHCRENARLVMAQVCAEIAPVKTCVRAIAREMGINITGEM